MNENEQSGENPLHSAEAELAFPLQEDDRFGAAVIAQQPDEPADRNNRALFTREKCGELNGEWRAIQESFVDDPRHSVENANALVAKTIETLSSNFAQLRNTLEEKWDKDAQISTEDLRLALQSYRSFFRRLLSV